MQKIDAGRDGLPKLHIAAEEHERLLNLAEAQLTVFPDAAERLLAEADRAVILPAAELPAGTVRMHSVVEFRDENSGEVRRIQLVWPNEADISAGRVSIMTLIGAALIGLSEGQSISWPKRQGEHRQLTVLRVAQRPAAGRA